MQWYSHIQTYLPLKMLKYGRNSKINSLLSLMRVQCVNLFIVIICIIVCLFALVTVLFRLDECPFVVDELQKV